MYPKLWEYSGIPYNKLVDRLIRLGIERWKEKQEIRTSKT
jgi:D-alanine-D-alanine ligase